MPGKCCVGVMGWLLSCRQAYQEGINILYASNTFHTSSKRMILRMPALIQQRRLDTITSFEIVWETAPWLIVSAVQDDRGAPPLSDLASFELFMDIIPDLFPNIKKLHIAIQGDVLPRCIHLKKKRRNAIVEEGIIDRVDKMVRQLKHHVDFSVAMPTSTYIVQKRRALLQNWKVFQRHETGDIERYWRPLRYCLPRTGYWFCLGEKDVKRKSAMAVIGRKALPNPPVGEEYDVFFRR
ncbi:Ff.00g032560.m01.CDS01 [Fusarium sp. VM40]|nr:Ff.00g032560.m01.CDS01 [Fusarium sp. VM40]